MEFVIAFIALVAVILGLAFAFRAPNEDKDAQRLLDEYLSRSLSGEEIGRFYERYIGHLYEMDGHDVLYNGAVKGYEDFGRDLIVRSGDTVRIVQTKCWSKKKFVQEKEIFQLYGAMTHFKLTTKRKTRTTTAVFCTTTRYSERAREAAQVLGVELVVES